MPFPLIAAEVIGAGLGYLASRSSNAAAVREAEKNRQFQAEQSATAHQREVQDMIRAGINPVLSAHGSGASTPGGAQAQIRDTGEGISRGISSALAVSQMKANIDLTNAQAAAANAAAQESNVRAGDILNTARAGRLAEITSRAEFQALSVQEKRNAISMQMKLAQAELESRLGSAAAAKATAALNEAALAGRLNEEKLQKLLGTAGPAVQRLLEMLRLMK